MKSSRTRQDSRIVLICPQLAQAGLNRVLPLGSSRGYRAGEGRIRRDYFNPRSKGGEWEQSDVIDLRTGCARSLAPAGDALSRIAPDW